MSNSGWKSGLGSHRTLRLWGGGAAFLVFCGAAAVFAQATLPPLEQNFAQDTPAVPATPAAPATPATPPAPPPAPANQPPSPEEARARAAALAAKANVDITGAWARATPGNATTAAVYLHIVSAKDPDKLLGAESGFAEHVEVHDDTPQNGIVKMTPLPTVDIQGGGTLDFTPGVKHFMLVGLKAPLKEGESFLMTLKFDKAGTQTTPVKILNATATGLPAVTSGRQGDTTASVTQVPRPPAPATPAAPATPPPAP